MRHALLGLLAATAVAATISAPATARGDALHRTVAPMSRADGAVCDLLRPELDATCKRVAHDGNAAVYQSRAAGIRRLVLAIDTGSAILVGPAVDVLDEQLESARPTLRSVAIGGRPGVALDLVSTWRRGKTAERTESLIGCAPAGEIWKCSQVDVGSCGASLASDGSITTSCGATASL